MTPGFALVTGASSGIGLEIARLLALRGTRLILTARSVDRLTTLAGELLAAGSPEVVVLPADLERPDDVQQLIGAIERRGLVVETLVNNAGFGVVGSFATQPAPSQGGMVSCNVTALTTLTRAFLPGMLTRRQGAVLNVASTAGFQPGPWLAVYYATKAYVVSLSEALRVEMRGTGVHVVTLCPGPTTTGFAARAGMKSALLFRTGATMDARRVALAGVNRLDRGGLVIPGFMNRVLLQVQRIAPRSLVTAITARLNRDRTPRA